MDINSLRILTTIVSFILFIGILVWVWKNRNNPDLKDAANLPFKDDQS
jgi:cytochrome c oxidase cbb3-type subunit 4